jgi:hypothetical protein
MDTKDQMAERTSARPMSPAEWTARTAELREAVLRATSGDRVGEDTAASAEAANTRVPRRY